MAFKLLKCCYLKIKEISRLGSEFFKEKFLSAIRTDFFLTEIHLSCRFGIPLPVTF